MPSIKRDLDEESRWTDVLEGLYEENDRKDDGLTHVSDLIMCLRQPVLAREYPPEWDLVTLFRFQMGRAFEKAFFETIVPYAVDELLVEDQGITGHIDFGLGSMSGGGVVEVIDDALPPLHIEGDPLDFECKLTWSYEPESLEEIIESKFWWFEQAGTYTIMRRRTKCRFVVLWLVPIPKLRCYLVEWSKSEQVELWRMMTERDKYVKGKVERGELPMKTVHLWLCKGCAVRYACDKEFERGR